MMRTKEQIKRTIDTLIAHKGRRVFSIDLKQEIIDSIDTIGTTLDAGNYYNIHKQLLYAWKRAQLGEVTVNAVAHGAHQQRFLLPTKIEVAQQILEHNKTAEEAALLMEVGVDTITSWVSDYQKGLFVIENCTQITRKPIRTYTVIMVDIKTVKATLASLKEEAQEHLDKEYAARSAKLGAL